MPDDTTHHDITTDTHPSETLPSAESGLLLVVREAFRGFAPGDHLLGEVAEAVLASEHSQHVVVLRHGPPTA